MSLQAAHDVLAAGAEVLQFVPVLGLAEAARVLVVIWDAVQLVDVSSTVLPTLHTDIHDCACLQLNQRACLRLTERCANLLISVREEIAQADGIVSRSPRSTHSSPLPSDPRRTLPSPGVRSSSSSPHIPSKSLSSSPHGNTTVLSGERLSSGDEVTPRLREKQLEHSGSGRGTPPIIGALGTELQAPMEKLIRCVL